MGIVYDYVIGDIHGCKDLLLDAMSKIDDHRIKNMDPTDRLESRIIFLGDYIDRGPDSKGVLDYLMDYQDNMGRDKIICLKGNHEQMFLDAFYESFDTDAQDHPCFDMWYYNGGFSSLPDRPENIWKTDAKYVVWMRSLPIAYDDGARYFVHAGIDPTIPLSAQREADQLWIRDRFLDCTFMFEKFVIHGHTPVDDGPVLLPNRLNMDTGAYRTGKLGVAAFERTFKSRFVFL